VNFIRKTTLILLFLCSGLNAQNRQDSIILMVKLQFDSLEFKTNKEYISTQKDTLSFESIRFYLTDFQFLYKDKSIYKETNSYHLIDFDEPESMHLTFKNQKDKQIESIQFNIGVDSLASVSGALEGDLDATKGMYWAWQSGYINIKIEGSSPSCNTRKNKFQFHIGGYLKPYYAMRTIKVSIEKFEIPNREFNLIMDLGKLFSEISLKDTNTIMIPGKDAMKIADLSTKIFSIK
jgi:hypothetical protein